MATSNYSARNDQGEAIKGVIDAASEEDLLNQLATDSARTGKALKGKKIGHIRLGKASSSAELKRHAIG